ncbi:hypothetical protein [uncultured Algimonas sp.]|uniref:hypothetical protein n=1 Tax=uncultured Algimonas sp. TaxID=1547920 RepID=UPI00261CACDF|nr:hypothetical protein [uncultured Algimonas sp.]
MPDFKFTAIIAAAALALSTGAFAQTTDVDATVDADVEIQADAETRAQAQLIQAPSTEGVVTDRTSCEYEGGSIAELREGTVCFIQIRGEEASTKIYDGQGLGVIRCAGNGAFPNEVSATTPGFCNVYLTEKKKLKTRAELEAELEAMTQAELEGTN